MSNVQAVTDGEFESLVLKLAQEGKTLPQKSTYFHPKPPSGMVLFELKQDLHL